MATKKAVTSWILGVTVVRAENIHSTDYWSEADCYVTVSIPSISARLCRTKTVANSRNPYWDETFAFNVNDNLKKTLEFNLYDDDSLRYDTLIATMKFDIGSLAVGKKETKNFFIHPEVKFSKVPPRHLQTFEW